MNIASIFIFVIFGYLILETVAATSLKPTASFSRCIQGVQRYLQDGGHRAVTPDGIKKYCHNFAISDRDGEYPWSKNTFFKRQSSDGDDDSGMTTVLDPFIKNIEIYNSNILFVAIYSVQIHLPTVAIAT